MNDVTSTQQGGPLAPLTKAINDSIANPVKHSNFDLYAELETVLKEVGLSAKDCGGEVEFYGKDPIVPSVLRFGGMSAIALAAKAVGIAAVWRQRTGETQNIQVDVRKALKRFCGFFDLKWETINGRVPHLVDPMNPFLDSNLFRKTLDGRHVVPLNIYPKLAASALGLLRCGITPDDVSRAILQWRADQLEDAAAKLGIVMAKVRTFEEFQKEPQYTEVLSKMPLITVEKIGESEPVPFTDGAVNALDGIRVLGMGHVIAGAAIGRDLALHGADVLNIWRPNDTEIEAFTLDAQIGMRQTILGDSPEDKLTFDVLLKGADIFFANKRPGFLESRDLDAHSLALKKPGIIHASVLLHGDHGPWMNRPGFDEIGAAVAGVFTIEGTPTNPKSPPIIPIVDNIVGWLGTLGILSALRQRAESGGSYRVTVSLTRTVLWLMSLGTFDKSYAAATAGSSDEHAEVNPDLFTAETPLGTYQGMTDQVVLTKTPGQFRTVLVPKGASKPEWLDL